jgi:hypothetical protein
MRCSDRQRINTLLMPYTMDGASDFLLTSMVRDMKNSVLFAKTHSKMIKKCCLQIAIIFSMMIASQETDNTMEHTAQCAGKLFEKID